jgi:uncharacterized membrane protein
VSGQHLHIALVHLPVLGLPAAAGLLGLALARGDEALTRTALWLPPILALLAVFATWSGSAGFDQLAPSWRTAGEAGATTRHLAESHALAGRAALFALLPVALFSLQLRLQAWRGDPPKRGALLLLLALCLLISGLLLWTAHQGGLILRPELR